MSRYIDADAIEYHEVFEGDEFVRVAYGDDIDNIPTADVVEVVRCNDCIFSHIKKTKHCTYTICNLLTIGISEVYPQDFYCAFGERKKDDKE